MNYEIIQVGATWTDAAQIAVSRGGKLVEIKSSDEQSGIFSALLSAGLNASDTVASDGGGGAYLWIGGNDIAVEGNWAWDGDNDLNTESFWSGTYEGAAIANSYVNWGTTFSVQNEPDDYLNQQDALAISLDGWPLGSAGEWNDVDQSNLLFSIVEYNAAPVFVFGSTFTIQENQSEIGQVQASDPNGDTLSYSISGGADQSLFSINVITGALTFTQAPDFENPTDVGSNNEYNLRVAASDGSSSTEQDVVVTVTNIEESTPNSPPTALDSGGTLVMRENEPVGTVVGVFQAQDPDGDALSYHLVNGLGDGNNSLFVMDLNGTLKTGVEFDYELYQSLSIRVAAMDEDNASVEGEFIVIVTDVDENVPNQAPHSLDSGGTLLIRENEPAGTVVGVFQAQDPDGDELYYYLVSGLGDGNNNLFVMDHHLEDGLGDGNNSLFVMDLNGTLRTKVEFDYESYQSLSIRVAAMDEHNASVDGEFTVIVTDVDESEPNQAPVGLYHAGSLSVTENEPAGTFVGTFLAQDPDGDALTYHLVSGLGDGNNSLFVMDLNGTLQTGVEFDYESYQSLSIRAAAMDEHNASVEGEFIVIVTDVDESEPNQAPVGLYHAGSLGVPENEPAGTFVGTFQAQDPDGDALTYHLVSGLGDGNNSLFVMDLNGTLKTGVEFDYESYQSLSIRVAAMDEDNASVEGEFIVILTDVDETVPNQVPHSLDSGETLVMRENEPAGTVVGVFQAQDPDGDALATIW